jgi:UDP-N-acetylmuramyl tripeptide synthase
VSKVRQEGQERKDDPMKSNEQQVNMFSDRIRSDVHSHLLAEANIPNTEISRIAAVLAGVAAQELAEALEKYSPVPLTKNNTN